MLILCTMLMSSKHLAHSFIARKLVQGKISLWCVTEINPQGFRSVCSIAGIMRLFVERVTVVLGFTGATKKQINSSPAQCWTHHMNQFSQSSRHFQKPCTHWLNYFTYMCVECSHHSYFVISAVLLFPDWNKFDQYQCQRRLLVQVRIANIFS